MPRPERPLRWICLIAVPENANVRYMKVVGGLKWIVEVRWRSLKAFFVRAWMEGFGWLLRGGKRQCVDAGTTVKGGNRSRDTDIVSKQSKDAGK